MERCLMKLLLRIFLVFILILSIIYLIFTIWFKIFFIEFNFGSSTYYIKNDVFLFQSSRYMVSLKGKYGLVPACVYKVGWNRKYVVALQYDLMDDPKDFRENPYQIPDKSKPNYYIIDLEKEELIGPLSEKEYMEYDCGWIWLKRTTT